MSDVSTTLALLEALRRRYNGLDGEWLFYREAWRIDAFAVRCWSAGIGHRRIAFEVKASRGDFLSEMRKPEKRARALELSHQFFFVTPRELVRKEEVPEECGLMWVDERQRLRIVKQAPLRAPRALKMREAIYLMRLPLYREGLLEMRQLLSRYENSEDWARTQRSEDFGRQRRLEERLVEYAKERVTVGSMWRGLWQPMTWRPGEEGVEIYVESMRANGSWLSVRRLDTGEVNSMLQRITLLTDFVPLDSEPASV